MISYCEECKKNLCDLCGLEHNKSHKLIYHRDIIEQSKITNLEEMRQKIDELKIEINYIIEELNTFVKNLEIYYDINDNIIKNFNISNKNYQILNNMRNLNDYNKEIINNINSIIKEITVEKKFSNLDKLYIKMIYNEIILKYKPERDKDIRILGKKFVENNKHNYKMEMKGNINELIDKIEKNQIKDEVIEIKLLSLKKATDLSYMFYESPSLISINDDFLRENMDKVNNMNYMFNGCE